MEVTLKKLSNNGAFANEVLFLTQQKAYSFGRRSQNDIVLFAPTVAKDHCIFHHNSNGLFVEVLKSLAGVVVNGKKYTMDSMVRLHNNDVLNIGFFKYQVEIKPIVQDLDTKSNFTSDIETDHERMKEENLSDMNIKIESELRNATGGIECSDYEEIWRSNQTTEFFNSEASMEVKEELILEKETREISSHEIYSSMEITIDEEDLKPLLPINTTGEALSDPKTILEISRNPEKLKLSEFSNFFRDETRLRINTGILQKSCDESFKNRVSERPKLNKITLKENEVSKNQKIRISKEQNRMFKEMSIVSNKQSEITPSRISDGISGKLNTIVLERLSIENSENAMKISQAHSVNKFSSEYVKKLSSEYVKKLSSESVKKFSSESVKKFSSESVKKFKTHSGGKLRNDSVNKLRTESSSSKRKLQTESVKLEIDFVQQRGIDSVESSSSETKLDNNSSSETKLEINFSSETKLEINSSSHEERKKHESSNQKIGEEIRKCSPSTRNMKSCQEKEKRLVVTLIDILKNPISDSPPVKKLPSNSENVNENTEPTRERIKSHEEEEFICMFCNKKLPSKVYLDVHEKMHDLKRPYRCEKCGKVYVKKSRLVHHVASHIEERFYPCPICEKTFKSQFDVKDHLRVHSGVRRQTCGICKKILAHRASLEYHMKTHTSKGEFKCQECSKLFFREHDLRRHKKIHTDNKQYNCPHCPKRYNRRSALSSHIWNNHSRIGLDKCNVCDKVFLGKNEFEAHERSHTVERPFVCQLCGKTFRKEKILKGHMRTHVARFTCNECEETFSSKLELTRHLRFHFQKERNICPECGYVAAYAAQLACHLRVHSGERPFKCLECNKSFTANRSLREHMVMHTGIFPYRCKKCGTGFLKPCLLRIHYNICHEKE